MQAAQADVGMVTFLFIFFSYTADVTFTYSQKQRMQLIGEHRKSSRNTAGSL